VVGRSARLNIGHVAVETILEAVGTPAGSTAAARIAGGAPGRTRTCDLENYGTNGFAHYRRNWAATVASKA